MRVTPVDHLTGRASPDTTLRLLSSGMTADATQTFLVEETPPKILQISPDIFPAVVREAAEKAEAARAALGDALGWAVVTPIDRWEVNGISCAFYERLTPISGNRLRRFLQRKRITRPVLEWLRKVVEIDRGPNEDARRCLAALADCPYASLRETARHALERVRRGLFVPRSRVMHADFWIGNIMLDPKGAYPFKVIDWRGSHVDGFPIFDLIRFAESVKLAPALLRGELEAHAQSLGCDLADSRSYLLTALGSIWLNLDQFPPERFEAMAERSLRTHQMALNC